MRDTQLPYTVSVVFPIQFARLDHLSVCMLHFPLPLGSHFPPPLTTRYTTAFTIHVAFPTAIELLQLPLVDNYTPACTTHQNIFHHHQLLNLQVVLSSLLQPANTTALTTPSSFRVAFHQLSSISHGLFYYCLFSQQTQPQRALTTASTAMTPPLTTCCSPSKHSTLHSSSSISHSTTAISTGSPSS